MKTVCSSLGHRNVLYYSDFFRGFATRNCSHILLYIKNFTRNPIEVQTQREGGSGEGEERRKLSQVNIKAVLLQQDIAAPHFVCPPSYLAQFSLLEEGSPLGVIPTNL
jgi:hypothetical protein